MSLTAASPPPHGAPWPELMADQAGMNWMWLEEAARFATENETPWPYDLRRHLEGGFFQNLTQVLPHESAVVYHQDFGHGLPAEDLEG